MKLFDVAIICLSLCCSLVASSRNAPIFAPIISGMIDRIVGGIPVSNSSSTHPSPPPASINLWFRIVGGSIVPSSPSPRYPYIVSLRTASNSHFCGGSLIAPSVVLTAAHCLDQTDQTLRYPVVNLGRYYRTSNALPYSISQCKYTIIHPDWSFAAAVPSKGDVALCILPQSFPQYENLRLSLLPPPTNGPFTVIGWGTTTQNGQLSEALQEVNVDSWNLALCNESYSGVITDGMICAGEPNGGKDACQGDSGGPLFVKGNSSAEDVDYGIVSFGEGCAQAGYPGVYTSVPFVLPWILEQLDILNLSSTLKTPQGFYRPPSSSPGSNETGASPSYPNQDLACACTTDGVSGDIQTSIIGCQSASTGGFCYVVGGPFCIGATSSSNFSSAAWLPCGVTIAPSPSPAITSTRPGLQLWGLFAQTIASILGR